MKDLKLINVMNLLWKIQVNRRKSFCELTKCPFENSKAFSRKRINRFNSDALKHQAMLTERELIDWSSWAAIESPPSLTVYVFL